MTERLDKRHSKMVDGLVKSLKKRRLIKKILHKQGLTVPEPPPTIVGMVQQDYDLFKFKELVENLATLTIKRLRDALQMERVPG